MQVVPYNLRCLIVGTCCVSKSWDLSVEDVNSMSLPDHQFFYPLIIFPSQ